MTPEEFVEYLDAVPDRFMAVMGRIIGEETQKAGREIKNSFRPFDTAKRYLGQLNERSGMLKKSLGATLPVQDGMTVKASVGLINMTERMRMIAEVQEYGAVIRPRKAQLLAVPVAEGLNADGTRKFESIWDADREYDYVQFTDTAIYGHRRNAVDSFGELIAVRKELVEIDDNPFIQAPVSRALDQIEDRLYDDKAVEDVF